jgi:fatty-acyl-CoA synthase/long-chain acyl-CoA synthetase
MTYAGMADRNAIETEMPWPERDIAKTLWQQLTRTAAEFPQRPAVSYQLLSGPADKAETVSWAQLRDRTAQAANLFRSLGVGENDVVAYVLPNCNETVYALLGGAVAGIVNPINPLLEAEQIGAILRETNAKVVVTLKAFPKTEVAQKMAEAVRHAPGVHTVLEIDLNRYLTPPKSWIVPLIRPKNPGNHHAAVKDFVSEMKKQPTNLQFDDSAGDRIAAYFHTGGTTGMPKVAQHKY